MSKSTGADTTTDAKEPEFIESLLHSEECGRSVLYDVYENEVCSIAEIVNHIDTLTRERDALRTVDDAMMERALTAWFDLPGCHEGIYSWEETQKFRTDGGNETRAFMRRALTAALAVQP